MSSTPPPKSATNAPRQPSSSATPPQIQFQALTDGLGFHPFSDGLPYAPVSKAQPLSDPTGRISNRAPLNKKISLPTGSKTQLPPSSTSTMRRGTGATSAGPAQYVPQLPRVSVPTASWPAPPAVASTRAPLQATESKLDFGMGYVLRRAVAYSIDTVIHVGLCSAALSVALLQQGIPFKVFEQPGLMGLSVFFLLVFHWTILTAQEIALGTSIGKKWLGLELVGPTSAVFLRAFFFLPSVGFLGLGVFWMLFGSSKRGWHDSVVDLQPTFLRRP